MSSPTAIVLEKLLNRVEAFSLLHYLKAHGIAARLDESSLRAALGEIPFLETAVELCLEDPQQREQAQALIVSFRSEQEGVRGVIWTCRQCGETHEPEFGACWNCGTPRR